MENNNQQAVPLVQPVLAGYPPGFHISLLNEIPKFEGNPSELSEYVRAVEDIFIQFWQRQEPGAYINKLLLSAARNRLKGPALEVVTGQELNSWDALKALLIENFGDQRSELNLKIDISRLRQYAKESPIDYFNRCRSLLAILNSKISLGIEDQLIKNYKLTEAKNLTLTAYISGLAEPLGSFIRSRSPQTLENALTYVKNEIDIRYFQNSNSRIPQQQFKQATNQIQAKPYPNLQRQQTQNNYQQQPYFNRSQPQFRNNHGPVYKLNPNIPPQNFPGFQPKYGTPGQNVFKPQRNFQPTHRPEPMEASTIKKRPASQQLGRQGPPPPRQNFPNNFRPNNFFQQSNQPRNFHSQELHHTELNEMYQSDIDIPNNDYQNFDYEYPEQPECSNSRYTQDPYPEDYNPENYDLEYDNENYFENENFRDVASE